MAHSFRTLDDWYPRKDNDIIVLFQLYDPDEDAICFERVIWAINDFEQERTNFKRFFTSYYPSNFNELMDKINNQEL